jgi:hypothetical protein
MIRNLKYTDAWDQVFQILETLEQKDDMLQLLTGQLCYVLEAYYKPDSHDTLLLNVVQEVRERIEEDKIENPEWFDESSNAFEQDEAAYKEH